MMMKTYSHIRRQALNEAAAALEPNPVKQVAESNPPDSAQVHESQDATNPTYSSTVPQHALTMGERFHDLGYATAVFSSNPWAGFASGLSAGLDFLSSSSMANGFTASASLNDEFERWRAEFPGTPFWAHFQSTDVHTDTTSTAVRPFNDLFRWKASVHDRPRGPEAVRRTDVDQVRYDQAIAHTDSQIARLVRYLKRSGEWQNTLFIVTADHSIAASGAAGRAIIRARRIRETPMFAPFVSHIPLIIVWSGHIESGMRVTQPVSLIDLLPSIFQFTGLPPLRANPGHVVRCCAARAWIRATSCNFGSIGWQDRRDRDRRRSVGRINGYR